MVGEALFYDYSMLFPLYEIIKVSFHLICTNGIHVKIVENVRFFATTLLCRQNLKVENLTSLFGKLRQRNVLKCVPHVQHDYFSSFNQIGRASCRERV